MLSGNSRTRCLVRSILCTVVALVALTYDTSAQPEQGPLPTGERIRVTAPGTGLSRQPVTFNRVEDGILLVTADTTLGIALDAVERIEVYAGRQSHPWRGAGIGFLGGAALGFGLWYAADVGCYPEAATIGCATVFGAFGGGVLGALIGLAVGGLLVETDRWEEVPFAGARLGVVPSGSRGLVVRLAVEF
jgi:hypothetical protein